jgi:hypothetical protein
VPVLPAWSEPSDEFKHVSKIGEDVDSGDQAFSTIYSNPVLPITWINDLSKGSLCDGIADGPGGISLPDPTTENEEIPKGLLWLAFRDIYGIEPLREMVADRLVKLCSLIVQATGLLLSTRCNSQRGRCRRSRPDQHDAGTLPGATPSRIPTESLARNHPHHQVQRSH